jgi:hypothetical protein
MNLNHSFDNLKTKQRKMDSWIKRIIVDHFIKKIGCLCCYLFLEVPTQKEREKERIQKENKKTWLEENQKYIY